MIVLAKELVSVVQETAFIFVAGNAEEQLHHLADQAANVTIRVGLQHTQSLDASTGLKEVANGAFILKGHGFIIFEESIQRVEDIYQEALRVRFVRLQHFDNQYYQVSVEQSLLELRLSGTVAEIGKQEHGL